jgi:hypothetical protein
VVCGGAAVGMWSPPQQQLTPFPPPLFPPPQGRKIVIFEMTIEASWEGELMDGEGRRCGVGDGDLVVTDLDQDVSGPAGIPLKITPSEDGGAADKQLCKLLDKWGAAVIRKRVWQFVEELKAKE